MVEKVQIIRWKTSDGSLFEKEEEAIIHERKYQEKKAKREALTKKRQVDYEALHQAVVNLYIQNEWPSDHCNCGIFNYSEECLVVDDRGNHHLCTCKAGICKRHTNLGFRNTGCFYCAYTDCSAHGC